MISDPKQDADLLLRLSRGEEVAYEELFLRYHVKICCFVRAIIRDGHAAEDIAQNVFFKLWANRGELSKVTSLNNYLFTISRNEACDHLRRQANLNKYADEVERRQLDNSYELQLTYDLERMERIVEQCVKMMPAQRRLVYRMSREEKLSNAEIAERLSLSKRTVDRHLSLALHDLRTALGRIVSCLAIFFFS